MKQIVIISGKGGTGKTVITAALASLAENKVLADCDVDAADLHLLLKPRIKETHAFKSGLTARIDAKKCTKCGRCVEICRFEAIDKDFVVDPISCEGCVFCKHVCPVGAVEMLENETGEYFISDTRLGPFVHARLGIAEENSGKLVSIVREKAKDIARKEKCDLILIDGAPGIGCPVIASITGASLALVITEPTLSGLHDAERVIKVAGHFKVPVRLVINKYDLNADMSEKIEGFCRENKISVIGKIPFDKSVVEAMVEGKTAIEYPKCKVKKEIEHIWNELCSIPRA